MVQGGQNEKDQGRQRMYPVSQLAMQKPCFRSQDIQRHTAAASGKKRVKSCAA